MKKRKDKTVKKDKDIYDLLKKDESVEEKLFSMVKGLPSINDIEKQIKKEGLFRVKVAFKAHTGMIYGNSLRDQYYTLIGDKVLKDDKKLMDSIIKFRERILKHRISCEAILLEKGMSVAGLKVYKILVEHGQEIVDYWVGKTIDPSSFKTYINDFTNYMAGRFATGTVNITQNPMKRCTVDDVSVEFEFS